MPRKQGKNWNQEKKKEKLEKKKENTKKHKRITVLGSTRRATNPQTML